MRRWIWCVGVVALAACGGGADGQPESADRADGRDVLLEPSCSPSDRMAVAGRASPYDSATIRVGEGVAKFCYGRPSLRGRTMIGGDAVPYDTLWRTGANEPTIIHLNVAATIAGITVQPGDYSLYTVPRRGERWTLIVNRSTSQWGHESSYTEEVRAQEVGRADVRVDPVDEPIEQLTIRPADPGGSGAVLEWQNSRVHIPIEPA
jgi:hypothetical protein